MLPATPPVNEWPQTIVCGQSSSACEGAGQESAIARALVHRPSVVFADEPTGALDEDNQELVLLELLKGGRAGGRRAPREPSRARPIATPPARRPSASCALRSRCLGTPMARRANSSRFRRSADSKRHRVGDQHDAHGYLLAQASRRPLPITDTLSTGCGCGLGAIVVVIARSFSETFSGLSDNNSAALNVCSGLADAELVGGLRPAPALASRTHVAHRLTRPDPSNVSTRSGSESELSRPNRSQRSILGHQPSGPSRTWWR